MPSSARDLVSLFLMTCAAMELKQDLLTVQMMDLADQTTAMDTLMMLVWHVNHVRNNIYTTYTDVGLLYSRSQALPLHFYFSSERGESLGTRLGLLSLQLVNWDNKNSQT